MRKAEVNGLVMMSSAVFRASADRPSPRSKASSSRTRSAGEATFSSPRRAASASIMRRRSSVDVRPSAFIRALTASRPTASMTTLVAVLSLIIIMRIAQSRSDSTGAESWNSSPLPATRCAGSIGLATSSATRPSAACRTSS